MKVLFLLSQTEVTGAETYALTLAEALRVSGHPIVFVSDTLRKYEPFKFYPLPIHGRNTSYWGRGRNVLTLRRIIAQEKIDLIHSHSRAANLVAHFAARRSGKNSIPIIATVHGRWRNTFAFRVLPCLGSRTVAVCPYLKRYLEDDIGISPQRVSMVPNGIDTSKFMHQELAQNQPPQILIAGRFSGQKGNVIRFLLREVMEEVIGNIPGILVKIPSSPPSSGDRSLVEDLNRRCGREAVQILDWQEDLAELYKSASVVVGSGRVALEAMASGRPVVSIGESSAPGLVEPENFDKAFDCNFGDCGEWNLFEKDNHVARDIARVLKNRNLAASLSAFGRDKIVSIFDSKKVAAEIEKLYRSVLSQS